MFAHARARSLSCYQAKVSDSAYEHFKSQYPDMDLTDVMGGIIQPTVCILQQVGQSLVVVAAGDWLARARAQKALTHPDDR